MVCSCERDWADSRQIAIVQFAIRLCVGLGAVIVIGSQLSGKDRAGKSCLQRSVCRSKSKSMLYSKSHLGLVEARPIQRKICGVLSSISPDETRVSS
jgi:hypothetical protein